MSNHHQLLYHIVFSTKNRKQYLKDGFREKTFAYMAGVRKELGGFALKIGGYYDHVHLLIRIPAKINVSSFVGRVKANTSKHINDSSGNNYKFGWQDGFGAFTVSISQRDRVAAYIENQMQHHASESFENEYLLLLKKHQVEYDEQYIFD